MATRTYIAAFIGLMSLPAGAQTPMTGPADLGTRAVQTARTPVEDLNIDKDDVPDKLFMVQFAPYDLTGLNSCEAIATEVAELTALLGPDVDRDVQHSYGVDHVAMDIGSATLLSLIPFRGVIREVSGAAAKDRRIQWAVWHGQARRSYLKGVGGAWGCAWPAAPVPILRYEMAGF